MPYSFLDVAATPSVRAVQAAMGSDHLWESAGQDRSFDRLTAAEIDYIGRRDSFYMATVNQAGWPYVQHRGGAPGFLKVLDATTLAFPDFRGNRQYLSVGNLAADDRVSLILVDYANRARLKILGHMQAVALEADPVLRAQVVDPTYRGKPERILKLRLKAFDWNCPQHITPRFTQDEIALAMAPLRRRLAALEAETAELRARLAGETSAAPS